MKSKRSLLNRKSLTILSVVLLILFILIFFFKEQTSSLKTTKENPKNKQSSTEISKSNNTLNSSTVTKKAHRKNNKTITGKPNAALKKSSINDKKITASDRKREGSKSAPDSKLKDSLKTKVKLAIKKRPKTFKYSKRFLQIDQDLERYVILKNVYYLKNTSKNRAKYPTALIQDSFIKVKSKKKLKGESVLQNKESKNFSLFKRVVKFQVKDEMGSSLLSDLKGFSFIDMNELSMVNYKYILKFKTPQEAFKAYSLIKGKEYLKWASIDVFEFIKNSN